MGSERFRNLQGRTELAHGGAGAAPKPSAQSPGRPTAQPRRHPKESGRGVGGPTPRRALQAGPRGHVYARACPRSLRECGPSWPSSEARPQPACMWPGSSSHSLGTRLSLRPQISLAAWGWPPSEPGPQAQSAELGFSGWQETETQKAGGVEGENHHLSLSLSLVHTLCLVFKERVYLKTPVQWNPLEVWAQG